jgi:hypothetical protein
VTSVTEDERDAAADAADIETALASQGLCSA